MASPRVEGGVVGGRGLGTDLHGTLRGKDSVMASLHRARRTRARSVIVWRIETCCFRLEAESCRPVKCAASIQLTPPRGDETETSAPRSAAVQPVTAPSGVVGKASLTDGVSGADCGSLAVTRRCDSALPLV